MTNARMQEITGEHSKDITGVLQTLVRDGLLTQQNQRRWASYRVAGDSPQLAEDSRHLNPELLSLAEPARLKAKLPTVDLLAIAAEFVRASSCPIVSLEAFSKMDAFAIRE